MDKNMLKGMVVVAVVIFAFMLLSKPGDKEKQQQQPQTEAMQQDAAAAPAEVLDSIHSVENTVARASEYIRKAGVPDAATGAIVYDDSENNVTLTLADSEVGGTIRLSDTVAISYADLVASRFPEEMTFSQKKTAISKLRQAVDNARRYGSFASLRNDSDDSTTVKLSNKVLDLEFSNLGGYISKATLKDYFTYFPSKSDPSKVDTLPVVMFSQQGNTSYDFTLHTYDGDINTSDLYFRPVQENDSTVLMSLDLPGGAQWGIRYTLPQDDSYIIHMDVVQKNMASVVPPSKDMIDFAWGMDMPRLERGSMFEQRNSGVYYKYVGESPDNIDGNKSGTENLPHAVRWLSFKNQFFTNVIIPRTQFESARIKQTKLENDARFIKNMRAGATLAYNPDAEVAASFDYFIGPNLYPLLNDINDTVAPDEDLQLTRLVPLGWSWLRWINTLIVIPVFNFLGGFISDYGIIILLLTLFIKLILFPFTYKSYKSQAKMRVLAPEIKEINEQYPGKENAMLRQQKQMALYSRAGASPFSGCLPLLLQMPILIAMFSFFPSCIELRGQSFLWAHDLAAPDVILTLPFSIPFYGDKVSLFCLLMTAVNIVYTRINMQNQPSQQVSGMKWMMYLMPVMFLFFFNSYPAALSYYYFLSLLITIIQTYLFRRFTNEDKLRKKMMENAAKPKKKSGFMARLEEAQRKQQAALRAQQQKNNRRR